MSATTFHRIVAGVCASILTWAHCAAPAQGRATHRSPLPASPSSIHQPGYDEATGWIHSQRWNNGVPLGGLGCGKVDLLTDGSFGNLTINHNWDRRTAFLPGSFAAIRAETATTVVERLLRLSPARVVPASGTVDASHNSNLGNTTTTREFLGVRNIAATRYLGQYPKATVQYDDADLPLAVTLDAFSPMVPHDVDDSALPVAMLRYTLRNTQAKPVKATLAFSWQNMLGWGGSRTEKWEDFSGNTSVEVTSGALRGILFTNTHAFAGRRQNAHGQYFVGTSIADSRKAPSISTRLNWDAASATLPSLWSETDQDQPTTDSAAPKLPASILRQTVTLAPGEVRALDVVLTWHMPTFRTVLEDKTPSGITELQTTDTIKRAFDGNSATAWTTGRVQIAGDSVTFDYGDVLSLTALHTATLRAPHDYPWGYKVEASTDGTSWATVAHADLREAERTQFDGALSISFPPTPARFLRLTTGETATDRMWTIEETSATAKGLATDVRPVSATVTLNTLNIKVREEDLSHPYVARFADALSVARYALDHREKWLQSIEAWHQPVLQSSLPTWLKTKLINSLFVFSSNTILTRDGRYTMQESPVSMAGATGTMDQRFAAHAGTLFFFPELDRRELDMFGACQDLVRPVPDGRITHFTGNIQQVIGNPNVFGGVRNWADLTSSYIMQVLKTYRWTGDQAFLSRHAPRALRAMAWLSARDFDGDLLPEGGSTFDYEPNTPGAFVYSANMYLGALRASATIANLEGQTTVSAHWTQTLADAQASLIRNLWNGQYFMKWNDPRHQRRNANSFAGALAACWHTRLSGLESILPSEIESAAIRAILARHVSAFPLVPPMEVDARGKAAVDACYIMQLEPFVGMEAIAWGHMAQGLEVLRRVHEISYQRNRDAWSQPLWVEVASGARHGLVSYMTAPTSWFVLPAIAGASLNVPEETLDLNPQPISQDAAGRDSLRIPLFFPTFWANLEVNFARQRGTLTILRTFGDQPLTLRKLRLGPNRTNTPLPTPFRVSPGARLEFQLGR